MQTIPKPYKIIFLILLSLALVPYIFNSIYSNPVADDFCWAYRAKTHPFWQAWADDYLHWTGRYTSNILVLINPIVYDSFILYKIIPICMICLTIGSAYFFFWSILNEVLSRLEVLITSILFTLLYLHHMPVIAEGIYWYTGSVTYQLGCIFLMNYIGLLIRFCKAKFVFKRKRIHLCFLVLTLILTIGFNEVIALGMLFFSVFFLFRSLVKKSAFQQLAIFLLCIAVFFSCITLLAPGNSVRGSKFTGNHDLVYSIWMTLKQMGRFFLSWTSSLPLLALSAIFFFVNKRLIKISSLFAHSFYLNPVYSSFILLSVLFISIFPAYWSTGIMGQHRTMNVAWFLFIPFWFMNLNVWFNYLEKWIKKDYQVNLKIAGGVLILIIGLLMFTKNGKNSMMDILEGRSQAYDREMKTLYLNLRSNNKNLHPEKITNPPRTLLYYDLNEYRYDWINICAESYFGRRVSFNDRDAMQN